MTDDNQTNENAQTQALEQNRESTPTAPAGAGGSDMIMNPEAFEHGQRVAKLFASSQLVPQHLQGRPADCFLALHMAARLGEDPLMVAQNIVIVQGTAGWKAQWLISRANRIGVFRGRIKFDEVGTPGADDHKVTASAVLMETGETVSASASMSMAKLEGWTRNPKYQSMPSQMLSYRAASFLVRLYAPEAMLGYQSSEELEDVTAAEQGNIPREKPAENGTDAGANGTGSPRSATAALDQLGGDTSAGDDDPDAEPAPQVRSPSDQAAAGAEVPPTDAAGIPHDPRIHSRNMTTTADGHWRRKRGVSGDYERKILAEIAPEQYGAANSVDDAEPESDPDAEAAADVAYSDEPEWTDASDPEWQNPGTLPIGAGSERTPDDEATDAAEGTGPSVGNPAAQPDADQPDGADTSSYGLSDDVIWREVETDRDTAVADGDVGEIDRRILLATGVRDDTMRRNLLQSLQTAKEQASDNQDAQE